jgi:polyisoprenoid-binding protein YceI
MEVLVGVTFTIGKTASSRFLDDRFLLALFAVLAAHVLTPALYAQESVVQLDAAQTKIEFTLGDILHTVHGTFKLKNGTIRFDPSTGKIGESIAVDATSGESGNGSRDRAMHREILESGKFTEIVFTPNQVKGTLARKGPSQVEVLGQFRLHGKDHDVTLPIDIQQDGQQLQLTTHFIVPYVQWGLKNPSTFFLRVSDKVTIDIHAIARSLSSEAAR